MGLGKARASEPLRDVETLALREEAMVRSLRGRRFVRRFATVGLERSALATWAADAWLHRNRARMVSAQEGYVQHLTERDAEVETGPSRTMLGPPLPEGASALESAARIWCESSRMLRAICDALGIPYVHVLQPTLHDQGSKPLTDEEPRSATLDEGARRAVHQGYPRLRELGQELAAEGECCIDAAQLFADVQEMLYYDACHFRAPGTDMLAREAAHALLRALP